MFTISAAKHSSWQAARYINPADKAFFQGPGDKQAFKGWDAFNLENIMRTGFTDEAATRGAILVLLNKVLEDNAGTGQTFTAVPSMPLYDSEAALWNSANPFTEYNANKDQVRTVHVIACKCSCSTRERNICWIWSYLTVFACDL